MAKPMTPEPEEILDLEESIRFIRANFNTIYPPTKSLPKTIGNIPEALMDEFRVLADDHNLKMFELLAGLLDFYSEYEDLYATELAAQRALPLKRR
jgi:hypothetical protein